MARRLCRPPWRSSRNAETNPDLPDGILSGENHRVWTGADGTFEIVLPPGRGHLVVVGPNADYIYRTVSVGELQSGKVSGAARHFHAVMPLELRKNDEAREIKVELRAA